MSDQKKSLKIVDYINIALFPLAISGAFYIYSCLMTNDYTRQDTEGNIIYTMIRDQILPKEMTFQHYIEYFGIINAQSAVLLLLIVSLTLVTRLLSNTPNPHRDKQNIVLRLLNANIKNHLHQGLIFIALLSCWVLNFNIPNKEQISILSVMFLLSRAIYLLGNLFYIITGVGAIRGVGFILNMLCSFTIASRIFWSDVSGYLLVTKYF